jgi:hypothetical protein
VPEQVATLFESSATFWTLKLILLLGSYYSITMSSLMMLIQGIFRFTYLLTDKAFEFLLILHWLVFKIFNYHPFGHFINNNYHPFGHFINNNYHPFGHFINNNYHPFGHFINNNYHPFGHF